MIRSYKDLLVWQRSTELAVAIYHLTRQFPDSERFGLVSQMQRACVSISSNIAEGRSRNTRKEFLHFLSIAYGSGSELETQLLIAKRVLNLHKSIFKRSEDLLEETMKMLTNLIKVLKLRKSNPRTPLIPSP